MLPLPRFSILRPRSLAEALDALAAAREPGAMRVLAGGTDLVPNLKHGLFDVETLVAIKRLPGMRGASRDAAAEGGLRIGALTSLAAVAADETVRAAWPALALAVGQIAGPQLRVMGTIGGNLCLDTRCTYYNQTEHWRTALGYCLKRTGTKCHVVPGGTRWRDTQNETKYTTDKDGQITMTWTAPGLYWLQADVQDDKASVKQAKSRRASYVATFELLPP